MSDAAVSAATPKKATATKPRKPAAHPKYIEMTRQAISSLKERGGSSRQAILKYIMANFNVGKDSKSVNSHLKLALKSGAVKGTLNQSKGVGATGSFRIGEKPKESKPKVKKPKAAKPAKKKPKAKKAAGVKKPKAQKPKTPTKKAAAAKPKKSPAKKTAAKPKKSPAKKAAKKPKSPKKAAKKPAKK